jgi:hypothetical protein
MTPDELEAALIWANKINLEVYYFWCTAIMVLIHKAGKEQAPSSRLPAAAG